MPLIVLYLTTKNEPIALTKSIDYKTNYLTIGQGNKRMLGVKRFVLINKGG